MMYNEGLHFSLAYAHREDGLDKSRRWNVFGGLAVYKYPEEALIPALKRENMESNEKIFAPEAMQEFTRLISSASSTTPVHLPGAKGNTGHRKPDGSPKAPPA